MAAARGKEYLGCTAGGVHIGIDVDSVQEVVESRFISRLPGCPDFILGMVNIRGSVVPVLDLLNVRDSRTVIKQIAILKTTHGYVGLLIARVDDLHRFDAISNLGEVPPQLAAIGHALMGMGTTGGHEMFIIDVERMIASTIEQSAR